MKSLITFFQIHRKVKQHATRFSLVVVIFIFGLFLEAYMHDFNLVYITLFFIFSFAFSAGPIGVLNIGNLKAKFIKSERLFVNMECFISVNIKNISERTSWAITLHSEDSSVSLLKLKAESSIVLKLPHIGIKRGSFLYKNCYLESKYPLSTARLTLAIDDLYNSILLPEPKGITLASFLSKKEMHYGEEQEFDGVREYDGTQNISHIHWASVAKGNMAVKYFTKETQALDLVFDFYNAGKNDESRLSQLCLWVLECEKRNLPFTIQLPKRSMNSAKESIDEILETLANY